jgi:hypothetical protein
MTIFEGPATSAPGLSVFETIITFLVIPTAMFVVISVLAYALTAPKKSKAPSAITTIE